MFIITIGLLQRQFVLLYGQAWNIRQNYECTISKDIFIGGTEKFLDNLQ